MAKEENRRFLLGLTSASEATIDVFFSTPLSASTAVWYHQRIWLPLRLSLLCGPVKTL
jgi:hypothetical protein